MSCLRLTALRRKLGFKSIQRDLGYLFSLYSLGTSSEPVVIGGYNADKQQPHHTMALHNILVPRTYQSS